MATAETNARALAAVKGYVLIVEPDGAIVAMADGVRLAAAVSWPAMLAWLAQEVGQDMPYECRTASAGIGAVRLTYCFAWSG